MRKRRSLSKNGLAQFSQGELKKPVRLSFVIPAYNEEACLGKCLDSIMAETSHFPGQTEVIVVDNASSDRTWVVASAYPGVHIVYEPRKGIVWARQAGFTAARGDLIANIDADNMLPKGWLTKVFKEFSQNNKLVALSGPLVYHDVSRVRKVQTKLFYGLVYPTHLINHFLIRKGGMVQGGNFVLRKTALDRIGGYNTAIDFYGEDTDIARRMQPEGRIKFTFALPIYSSGRRLKTEGFFTTGFRYAMNYVWVLIFKRPFDISSTDIRTVTA